MPNPTPAQKRAKEARVAKLLDGIQHKDLMTTEETAAYLSMNPMTLRTWRSEGLDYLPFVILGEKKVYYSKQAIIDFAARKGKQDVKAARARARARQRAQSK